MPAKSRRCPLFGHLRLDCRQPSGFEKNKTAIGGLVVIESRRGMPGRRAYLSLGCGTVRRSPGSEAR